jgi:toluene monooxygenase system ferredoxin subunit
MSDVGIKSWVAAADLDDLWEGEMLPVTVDGVPLLLCNVGGEVLAYEDRCPHEGSVLSDGTLDANVLTCARHEWVFDARSGCGINPSSTCLRSFPVRLDGDTVLVGLGAGAA